VRVFLVCLSLALAGCFPVEPQDGTVHCSVGEHRCPSNYFCAADDTCWRNGHDAGASDGANQDASMMLDLGPPGCAQAGGLLCEDFESGAIDTTTWTVGQSLGAVTVDNVHVHRGSFALHSHLDPIGPGPINASAQISEDRTFPALQDGFYARWFMYVPAPASWPNVTFAQQHRMTTGMLLTLQAEHFQFYEYATMPDHIITSATLVPTDRWLCVEWATVAGASHTWLDGVELKDTAFTATATAPIYRLTMGTHINTGNNVPAVDIWYDDILVDSAPIGCTR
jgi:hypothetical protein